MAAIKAVSFKNKNILIEKMRGYNLSFFFKKFNCLELIILEFNKQVK